MRNEGWEAILAEHIEQARNNAFEWGMNDCALWSADWVRKATGEDFASTWRGRYTTETELNALLAAMDIESPGDIASEHLPEMDVPFAQRGDIVLHPQGCLGICNGLDSYFLMEQGVTRIRTRNCVKAWAVR
ncbi:DUF6950 family protein [Tautonia marina]|uniref:DUF6950 family protein n=1 Tax=Tautonia marina TaxID=2653855 RepID=UPI00126045CC|nr:hypothetical protein [Tautonia marina]